MEAARETESPVIIRQPRCRNIRMTVFFIMMWLRLSFIPRFQSFCIKTTVLPETCFSAMEQGFTSVVDGSLMADGKTASTFEYNVEVTRGGRFRAPKGVSVE